MELLAAIEKAGIVGAGGAGFPTHVKLNASADTVIINGAECEPLLRVDRQLMETDAEKLLAALELMVSQVGAKRGIIALKHHYHGAVQALEGKLYAHPRLSVHKMESFYPAGDEQVLVLDVTGRIVPEGGIPIEVGVLVSNVETALNLYDAVYSGTPVTEKYVTVAGAVNSPKTLRVPIGLSLEALIHTAGGAAAQDFEVINGGPMMGRIVSVKSTVTKTTKGIIIVPKGHSLLASLNKPLDRIVKDAAVSCMQCSFCTEVCPRANLNHRLAPNKIMRLAGYNSLCDESYSPMNAYLCSSCRLCEYACIMGLQPWKLNGHIKGILGKNRVKNTLHNKPDSANPFNELKRYPTSKLIRQLDLEQYDVDAPIEDIIINAEKVILPLGQNVGAVSAAVVKVGDMVKKGQLIAKIPEGALGANLHASIDGIVTELDDRQITISKL